MPKIYIQTPVVLDNGAFLPERAHKPDAGFDLFAPKEDIIPAKGSVIIDTGVHIAIPYGYAAIVHSRSSMHQKGVYTSGLIDSGYTGSIKVKLDNLTDSSYLLERKDKIAQLVFIKIPDIKLCQQDKLQETERGDGGFGSTGR